MSTLHEQTNVALISYQILLADRGIGEEVLRNVMPAEDIVAKAWELSDLFIAEREKREAEIKAKEDAEFEEKVKESFAEETEAVDSES